MSHKITYTAVTPVRHLHADQSAILCVVKFDHMPNPVHFTAANYDAEPHGRQMHADVLAGKHGPVGAFVEGRIKS